MRIGTARGRLIGLCPACRGAWRSSHHQDGVVRGLPGGCDIRGTERGVASHCPACRRIWLCAIFIRACDEQARKLLWRDGAPDLLLWPRHAALLRCYRMGGDAGFSGPGCRTIGGRGPCAGGYQRPPGGGGVGGSLRPWPKDSGGGGFVGLGRAGCCSVSAGVAEPVAGESDPRASSPDVS